MIKWSIILFLAVILYSSSCNGARWPFRNRRAVFSPVANTTVSKRVVNVVAVFGKHNEICTGMMLSDTIVLTAAHCLKTDDEVMTYAFVSIPNGKKQKTDRFYIHKLYSNEQPCNDVALLFLKRSLPVPTKPLFIGCGGHWQQGNCTAYGIGLTEENSVSTFAREVKFPLIQPATTKSFKGNKCFETYYSGQARLCSGDSGGPVVCSIKGQDFITGVNIQIVSQFNAEHIVDVCKLAHGSIIANTNAIMEMYHQIPFKDRMLLQKAVKTEDCK